MAIPILHFWQKYFNDPHEGLGSTYERFIINGIIDKIVKEYNVKSVLETPSFGFTGLSGINSLGLALDGVSVTVNDNDGKRLELIKNVWANFKTEAKFEIIEDFCCLPYEDKSFDMIWNFSAMWFVNDLEKFCNELSRLSKKIILIMVPNTSGLGYIQQKHSGKKDIKYLLKEENIIPKNFIACLGRHGWVLSEEDYLDCPLWPDIGMSKEDFLKKFRLQGLLKIFFMKKKDKVSKPLTIVNYYDKSEIDMKSKMKKYNLFERIAPNFFKKFWAHHHYYLFVKSGVKSSDLSS